MNSKDEEMTGLWTPPASDSQLKAASNHWSEASKKTALESFKVAYGGGVVQIEKGDTYFVDAKNRVLVGWHGTYNPPRGMDGYSMIEV